MDPQQLQRELRQDQSADLRRRRAIAGVSLAGMASMSLVSSYQTGLIKHLPDVPLRRFDWAWCARRGAATASSARWWTSWRWRAYVACRGRGRRRVVGRGARPCRRRPARRTR
jgi:hypothetical protein